MKLSDLGTALIGTSGGLFIGSGFIGPITQNKGDNLHIMFALGLTCWVLAGVNAYREWKLEQKTKP